MPGFYSLQIARSALYTSQKALEVTGHNIANANTKGYSRQRLELSSKPSLGGDKFSLSGTADVGGGVTISSLKQIRDSYLDAQYRRENSVKYELDMKNYSMKYIEGIFSEPSEHGISSALSDFFNSFEELNKTPHDESIREIIVQNGVRLTETMSNIAKDLINYQQELNRNITLKVDEINDMAKKISDLNQMIFNYELTGQTANDLRDNRNSLIDQLSSLIPVTTEESPDGKMRVNIASIALVDNNRVNELEVRPVSSCKYSGETLFGVYWKNAANEVSIQSGQIRGMLDIRDGITENNKGIPYFLQKLDTLASTLVHEFNAINRAGYTLPYESYESMTGVDFFDPEKLTAVSISISQKLLESGYNIAASGVPVVNKTDWGNFINAINFKELRDKTGIVTEGVVVGNIESYFQKTLSELAITTGYYDNRFQSQRVLSDHLENQRLAVSEVSIDEEMINMVQFQHSYSAAARFISIIDQLMNEVINLIR